MLTSDAQQVQSNTDTAGPPELAPVAPAAVQRTILDDYEDALDDAERIYDALFQIAEDGELPVDFDAVDLRRTIEYLRANPPRGNSSTHIDILDPVRRLDPDDPIKLEFGARLGAVTVRSVRSAAGRSGPRLSWPGRKAGSDGHWLAYVSCTPGLNERVLEAALPYLGSTLPTGGVA